LPPTKASPLSSRESEFYHIFVLGDVHYPGHDPRALELALTIFEDGAFDEIVLNGDIIDCHALSSYPENPKIRTHTEDEEAWLNQLLDRIELHPTCTKFVYIEGNHEQRLSRDVHPHKNKYCKTWEDILELKERGWEWHPYHQRKQAYHPLGLKHITIRHGLSRMGVNFLQQVANNTPGGIVIGGHKHQDGYMHGVNRETGELGVAHSHGWLGDWTHPVADYMKNWQPWSHSVLDLKIHLLTGQCWVHHHKFQEIGKELHAVVNGYHYSI
jgi:predicted phosphodiesterase